MAPWRLASGEAAGSTGDGRAGAGELGVRWRCGASPGARAVRWRVGPEAVTAAPGASGQCCRAESYMGERLSALRGSIERRLNAGVTVQAAHPEVHGEVGEHD